MTDDKMNNVNYARVLSVNMEDLVPQTEYHLRLIMLLRDQDHPQA